MKMIEDLDSICDGSRYRGGELDDFDWIEESEIEARIRFETILGSPHLRKDKLVM
jgi:hypothetical protein